MDGNVIELVDLTKSYDSQTVVDHLSLEIKAGEVFGLLGPNGAGKSTTILMIMGLTEPDSGTVRVCGIDSVRKPIEVKKRVGYLPEDVGFYDEYTGLENLIFTARLNGMTESVARSQAESLLKRVGLSSEGEKKAGKYSHGMRQRLGLADVLIKNPEVIILDEPTIGIDPTGVRELLDLIVRLSKEEGITVLFSSHHLYQVQQVCDRVGLFVNGKLLAEGNIQTLSQQLFSNNAFIVEAGISEKTSGRKSKKDTLPEIIRKIEGVIKVSFKDGRYRIECSRDLTPEIASAVTGSGASLNYLNKKEYGLNDIYYRYFEGGTQNE
jgi:ABC-2 type transport system ATP-binding protein